MDLSDTAVKMQRFFFFNLFQKVLGFIAQMAV